MSGDPAQTIRVILADDHQVVRRGIKGFLKEAGIEVVAEAENGEQAVALIREHQPDVAVLDVRMPDFSGIEVARRVREAGSEAGLLILTAFDDEPYILAAIEAGVNGYVLKTADAEEIVQAVHDVHAGRSVLDRAVVGKVLQAVVAGPASQPEYEPLSDRELEVLCEAARGLTNRAIAVRLGISDRTVQSHLRSVFDKLQVTNRTEAVVKAAQLGLLELPK
ncbi:MAG TPA: response regulator transcription factor [Aggregatilineales bacterium]|nr:response regulator transcription factor [Chloroflexota bacterium]HOA25639.1 response regulator transcription factor [Aggregatilineales bacterium]HPV05582.1 response regulator transcription factor [Aggregatilineales bacterium]HQA68806.1 response regulator transcription factor [Aggregatilineales bacterium]HQE18335.1 response regulator transcription factor [Aggregatilineales bacterium]